MKTPKVLVLTCLVGNAYGWFFWPRPATSSKCDDPSRGSAFYFGTTDLSCMTDKKGKRSASPSRATWTYRHRWVQYKGWYFERVSNYDAFNNGSSIDSGKCTTNRENRPAGYSNLSIDCIKGCTRNYKSKFGGYSLLWNNCHNFANKIVDVLCSSTTCPSWCL